MRGAKRQLWLPDSNYFWARVNRDGPLIVDTPCWEWARWCGTHGYGLVRPTKREMQKTHAVLMAHRVAWELANGPIPEGRLVLHRCDNRKCCNPDHLFLGDDQANVDDMMQKGRGRKARGKEQHLAKLTPEQVLEIRAERSKEPRTPLKVLAERYGVSMSLVSQVARGKHWKHL